MPRDLHRRRAARHREDDGGGDGVFTALLKAAAYSQAPRFTFSVLHPKQAAQLKKLPFDLRTAYAPRLAAVAVAAVALPVGVILGRALERRRLTRGPLPASPGARLRALEQAAARPRPPRRESAEAARLAARV